MDVQGFFIHYLLVPLLATIAAVVLAFQNKGKRFGSNRKLIMLLLVIGLLLGLPGALGMLMLHYMPWGYITSVVYNLLLGGLLVYVLMARYKYEMDKHRGAVALFCLVALLLGVYLHQLLFRQFDSVELAWWAASSTFNFILPLLFWWCFHALLAVPAEIYKVWQYPEKPLQLQLEGVDFNRMLVLELEIFKSTTDIEPIRVKVKAPTEMNFGDWFYKFIDDYNLKFPNSPVRFYDQTEKAYLWIFFIKNNFFKRNTFIDPDLNIQQNAITEKMTIYAKRVSLDEVRETAIGDESIFI